MPPNAACAGWTIAFSRPAGRGAALARRVRALGGVPLMLPGTSLRATGDAHALATAARVVVFTSPAAVRHAFALAPGWRAPRGALVLAPGPGTCAALRRRGVDAQCPGDRHDSEGLLALPALGKLTRGAVLIVGAPGGRDAIAQALRERGVRVAHASVYRRALPRWTRAHHAALAAADPARLLWLVSSVESVVNVRALAGRGFTRLRHAIASSERVAAALREAGVRRVTIARSALPRDLLDCARAAITRVKS